MSGEIRSWWQACITELERAGMLKRYTSCAKEPKALYDRIGEDLDSSNEAIRNNAYWILVRLTPELINLLHEKETRNPGWKDREGKDQKTVNEGLDGSKCILKHLHIKFVKEHRFKVRDGNKKDPRPFLKETIENWKKDRDRKLDREVSLDYEAALEIPDPAGTPEDYIIETETYNDLWTEYKEHIQKVINPTREFQRSLVKRRLLETYPTELPRLNEATDANVLAYYYGWLISTSSNSLSDRASRVLPIWMG